ncbi:MAG: DUF4743 domain-containing protein [Zetaproteobacteria bacterium CG_4_9_14_3_um_filter_49_83]|nr:MAG: hypothetical protein AUJ56_08710 [Zetaproteobacteria bacterium CG1_02_49_23]PIQ32756.1 MAG: DUF4743 domain-containing protein [Zetaproteobacteria bacterium CG17_big_fil_post_rev_8_21_14_2_50_50_13]PIV29271.1 MAG: DUF4743 domain-containing protein [Zetaproteobacteria bacterium CG02_land_8_20_14_3_00_50_9]PIY54931.1 MAG: DUF4743 domain-containing protein [Zetaproteobacteria bacterium CG_4_10_14_0_8_um_filter_49_80]PJA35325.1 MAG: DUF4743 domain-containing protein [Zetaproteobacteria bacte
MSLQSHHGYLRHINFCNQWNPSSFIPFVVGDMPMGFVRPAFAESLSRFTDTFIVSSQCLKLHPALSTFEARNQAIAAVLEELVVLRVLDHLMGELYPVIAAWGDEPAFLIDRTAVSLFGIRAFGQHLNAIVSTESGVSMWIGRRAPDRHAFPDQLDQMVAGGLPFGITPEANLAKECEEEAGMPKHLVARAVSTGQISYRRENRAGLRSDTIFCYDIALPTDFSPMCTDGEVAEFYLWPLDEVARVVRQTDKFKPNCNLVLIDFFLRHGLITVDHPEYPALRAGLQLL